MPTPSQDDFRPGLGRPQFGLRTMLAFVAMLCALLAISRVVGGYGTLVIIFFLLTVVAHVAGNAIGTHLRDNQLPTGRRTKSQGEEADAEQLTAAHFAPTTKLGRKQTLGIIVVVCVVVGVFAGGVAGGWVLAWAVEDKATWANMSFGIGAFGVIGGILGFLTSSFLKVMIAANMQAWEEEQKRNKP